MIFLTVGTLFPFDRLVEMIDRSIQRGDIQEDVFAQIGCGVYRPKHMDYIDMLEKETFDTKLKEASCLISHAGMGSITMAMQNNKPLLVMPRLRRYKEIVNDHQMDTALKFEELGHLLVLRDGDLIREKIQTLKSFQPAERIPEKQKILNYVSHFIDTTCDGWDQ